MEVDIAFEIIISFLYQAIMLKMELCFLVVGS